MGLRKILERVCFFFKFRPSTCKFARIGCPWNGPQHELAGHENSCSHPQKSGLEIMDCLNKIDDAQSAQQLLFKDIFNLLSFEKVTFNGKLAPFSINTFTYMIYLSVIHLLKS